jgi:hypothetical protein
MSEPSRLSPYQRGVIGLVVASLGIALMVGSAFAAYSVLVFLYGMVLFLAGVVVAYASIPKGKEWPSRNDA